MRYLMLAAMCCIAPLAVAELAAVGAPAPEITVKDIRFLPRSLADFKDKEAYLFAFTSIGDQASVEVLKELAALEREFTGQPVMLCAVDTGNTQPVREVAAEAVELDGGYTVLKDLHATAAAAWGVTQIPAVVILDKSKAIAFRGAWADARAALAAVRSDIPPNPAETPVTGVPIPMRVVPVPSTPVTFAEHIAPIMHARCYRCHQPGEAAPFSLKSYNQVSARADMIAEVVMEGRMPPWYASEKHGSWINDSSLSQREKDLIVQWVNGGKQQGDPAKTPEAPKPRENEWFIGEPDLIIESTSEFTIPATGYIPYEYVTLPYEFPHDTWVSGIEILPSNPSVVHHANLAYASPGVGYEEKFNFLTGRVPGNDPVDLMSPLGMFIPKGAVLTLQIHYVTLGTEQKDRMRVGVRYADGLVMKKVHYKRIRPVSADLKIPPQDNFAEISAQGEIPVDALALALFSHMHLRARDMMFTAHTPDGGVQDLLLIPNYSFDWQLVYQYMPGALELPKGTIIKTKSHYDNSPFNPYNPDPNRTVPYGDQTFDEMNDAYVFYLDKHEELNLTVDGNTGIATPMVASAK